MANGFRLGLARLAVLVGEPSWVIFAFFAVAMGFYAAVSAGFAGVDELLSTTVGQLLSGGVIYALVLFVVIVPVLLSRGKRQIARLLGVARRPGLNILWLPGLLWVVYMAATTLVSSLVSLIPGFNIMESQDVGFDSISLPSEYVMAFVALVVLPPLFEELLFRGYLFGRLRERFGFWLTTIVVSIAFGIVHLQWNIGVDVAILSVFLCYLREKTGSIWASVVLHAIKNGLAYFLLFIAPLLGFNLLQ